MENSDYDFLLFSAGGEDDFEMFLESVRARSLKATAHLRKGWFIYMYSITCIQGPRKGSN